jgi:hypothetical protein
MKFALVALFLVAVSTIVVCWQYSSADQPGATARGQRQEEAPRASANDSSLSTELTAAEQPSARAPLDANSEVEPDAAELAEAQINDAKHPKSTIHGRVVESENGAGVRAEVFVTEAVGGEHPQGGGGSTNDSGGFTQRVTPGTYDIVAWTADGRAAALRGVKVEAGSNVRDLVVVLKPAAKLSVRCDSEFRYHPSFQVFCDGAFCEMGQLEGRGIPTLRFVPAGKITVRLTGAPENVRNRRQVVEVAAGEAKDVVFGDE